MALRALAHKWLRIIYKLWLTRTEYNEARHLINKKRRGEMKAA